MTREIKFRAWYTYRNSFYVYGAEAIRMLIAKPNGSDVVIEQWTGLKDVNGVDVYEGDIVHVRSHLRKNYVGKIVWSQDATGYCVSENTDELINIPKPLGIQVDGLLSYAVIGNIHENLELLEEK